MTVELILVPQGAEYAAVVRSLKRQCLANIGGLETNGPMVCPIPIGANAVPYLQHLVQMGRVSQRWQGRTVLLIGLGGSLSPHYHVGDVVIPKSICWAGTSPSADGAFDDGLTTYLVRLKRYAIAPSLVNTLYQNLSCRLAQMSNSANVGIVHGITSDRIVTTPQEKRKFAEMYDAELVEMEGAYILDFFQQRGADVGIVRVISDCCDREIPDLNNAIDPLGNLKTGRMIGQFLRQPMAAAHLIQGSLKGLRGLELIAASCVSL